MKTKKVMKDGCPAMEVTYDDGTKFVGRYNTSSSGVVGWCEQDRCWYKVDMSQEDYESVCGPVQYPKPKPGNYHTGYCYNCGSYCEGDCGKDYRPQIMHVDDDGNKTIINQPAPALTSTDAEIVACEDGRMPGAMPADI